MSRWTPARIGLWGGAALLVALLLLPAPDGLSGAGWRVAAVGLAMAVWWMTEALPIAATSLVPVVAFPVLGVASVDEAAAPYASPIVLLFLGGFLLAKAMERWGLHRRVALSVLDRVGGAPRRVLAGFIATAGLLSMGISNTATAVMMLPIASSAAATLREDGAPGAFDTTLLLGVAYACSVGGMGTLIGTPTNALLAGFVAEAYGVDLSFAGWLAVGLPFALLGLAVVYAVLLRFPARVGGVAPERAAAFAAWVRATRAELGPASPPERRVGAVFAAVAALWTTRPLWGALVPGASDAGVALLGALVLFAAPAGRSAPPRPRSAEAGGAESAGGAARLLDWPTAVTIPWGVLLLFGGGLSLAAAVDGSGLAVWIGGRLGGAAALPPLLVVGAVVAVVVVLTELTSNTATAAAFLPVLAALPFAADPLVVLVAVTFAASCAFMLPVATPPNAIVFGSGRVEIGQMMRAGAVLNVVFVVLATAWCALAVPALVDLVLPGLPAPPAGAPGP
ncbi:SLC13 family permease [Rubrivirga sp. S365]|uniref:SLC13 family permease n=1 Tax=Rubrivirga litoralis TaxID=3075598 RepID=A0ABU3BR78_9BACT|nr:MULTISPECIES: SLC13 family permease [unclassified Rubrivirga]MDT0631778.1 SLC13 family permease [Rubrivirga sp. F394]MDT7856530.1 SLC13 family permease [Rubrivirga sp. S365]